MRQGVRFVYNCKIDNLEKERKAKINKLSKIKQTIVVLMDDKEYVNEVKGEIKNYMGLYEELHQVHKVLLGLLPADDATKHDIWFRTKMLNVQGFIVGTTKWLAEIQSCPATVVDDAEEGAKGGQGEDLHDQKDDGNKNGVEAQNKADGDGNEEEIQIEP